jgi:hypothetical protein
MVKVIHLQDETYWELMEIQNKLQTEERQRVTADEMVKRLIRWAYAHAEIS